MTSNESLAGFAEIAPGLVVNNQISLGDTRIIILLLLLFVGCLNVLSMAALTVSLGGFSAILLYLGLRDLRLLLLILIALVPVQSSILGFGPVFGFELTFNRIVLPIAVALFVTKRSNYQRSSDRREPLLYILSGMFVLSVLTDLLGDGAFLAGAQRTFSESVEVVLFAYICYRVFGRFGLGAPVSAFAIGGITLCVSTVIERTTGLNLLFRFPVADDMNLTLQNAALTLDRADVLRVRGSFLNPVYLSGFLPLLMFAGAYLLLVQRRRYLGGALLLLVPLTAYLSISRTAVYSLAIFGMPIASSQLKRMGVKRSFKIAFAVVLLTAVFYAIFQEDFQRAFALAFNPNEESVGGSSTGQRLELITTGIPFVLALNPFGAGVDQAKTISLLLGPDIANFFVGYSIARGVIWVGAFCSVLAYMMWRLLRARDPVSRMLFWLTLSISVTYLSYAEYWISFPMLLVFVLIHAKPGAVSHQTAVLPARTVLVEG